MTTLTFKARVPVFDANVRVGDRHDEPPACSDRQTLLAEMDRHGVDRALIYHAQTDDISPVDGNLALEAWLGTDGRLVPQWSVMPTPASLAQIQALHAAGRITSVRLHDTWSVGLPFRPWAFADLLGWLSQEHIPVWIPLPTLPADDLVTTLQGYPDLVTVGVGAHYVHHLLARPLLRALPDLHLELSRYEPIGEIEALCAEFGAQRLIYGSWFARYAMGPMLFYLHHTKLREAELALICAGNVERILQGSGQGVAA
ncbi:MAG: hypothetical protein KF832_00855 [Caldilineaceae bacterium]|nr:hypothetical protein [Caldilineaceae bacterium]